MNRIAGSLKSFPETKDERKREQRTHKKGGNLDVLQEKYFFSFVYSSFVLTGLKLGRREKQFFESMKEITYRRMRIYTDFARTEIHYLYSSSIHYWAAALLTLSKSPPPTWSLLGPDAIVLIVVPLSVHEFIRVGKTTTLPKIENSIL